jgi:hypothetical protein
MGLVSSIMWRGPSSLTIYLRTGLRLLSITSTDERRLSGSTTGGSSIRTNRFGISVVDLVRIGAATVTGFGLCSPSPLSLSSFNSADALCFPNSSCNSRSAFSFSKSIIFLLCACSWISCRISNPARIRGALHNASFPSFFAGSSIFLIAVPIAPIGP